MGEVIQLHERRARRSVAAAPRERFRATFYFDLSCPFTYLAAERIERAFDEVVWLPASDGALRRSCLADDDVAAAGVALDECLAAAGDSRRDVPIERAGRALLAAGADRLPALRVGRALHWGERGIAGALTAARVARVAQG
jgi:2-hydroxychromene-2-carboxylate isomerase